MDENEWKGGVSLTLANGRKLEYFEDAEKVTIDYRLAVDVTDEKNKKTVMMGSYETKEGKKVFITEEQIIFNAYVDVLDTDF